jgi:hypothetical protein
MMSSIDKKEAAQRVRNSKTTRDKPLKVSGPVNQVQHLIIGRQTNQDKPVILSNAHRNGYGLWCHYAESSGSKMDFSKPDEQ